MRVTYNTNNINNQGFNILNQPSKLHKQPKKYL